MSSFWDKSWNEILLEAEKQKTDWVECDKVNIYLMEPNGNIKTQAYQVTQLGGADQIIKELLDGISSKKDTRFIINQCDEYNTMIQIPNINDYIIVNKGTCIITEQELFNSSKKGDIKKLVNSIG